MDLPTVQAYLNDLPPTFKRQGQPFTQWVDSLSAGLATDTIGTDGLSSVLTFSSALDGWLDVWGLLFGFVRGTNESNSNYATYIVETLTAWVGTLPALQFWTNLFAPGGSVVENLPNLGYIITLPVTMTTQQIKQFLLSLNRIRPAGVPFIVLQGGASGGGGLYVDTTEFLGQGTLQGAYLVQGAGSDPTRTALLGALTNNAIPLLPDLYLTDPVLNPNGGGV